MTRDTRKPSTRQPLPAFLLALLLTTATLVAARAADDPITGPGRTTLCRLTVGCIYYDNVQTTEADTQQSVTAVKLPSGTASLDTRNGRIRIVLPSRTLEISDEPNRFTIRDGANTYGSETGLNDMVLKVPGDEIRYHSDLNELYITGRAGKVSIRYKYGATEIISPVGKTVIQPTVNGMRREGPSVQAHPYVWRGLLIDYGGIGIYINLSNLYGGLNLPLDWSNVGLYRADL